MSQLGKAFIEVRADVSKFPAQLKKELGAAVKAGVEGVDFSGLSDAAAKAGTEAADKAGTSFRDRSETTMRVAGERAGDTAGRGIFRGIAKVFRRSASGGGKDSGDGLGGGLVRSILGGVSGALKSGLGAIQSAGGGIASMLGSLGGGGGDITSALKLVAFAAAIPVVFALGSALFQLSGILLALPAILGVTVAAVAPLVVAFNGVGEALSAGLSGDTEAFAEALKKLTPAAQGVVKEIVKFGPAFKTIGKEVQESFFRPLKGGFTALFTDLLPVIRVGMRNVAATLGNAFAGVIELLGSNDIVEIFGDVFESAGRVVANLAPKITDFLGVMFGVLEHGLPFAERAFAAIGRGIQQLTGFLSGSLQDGGFEQFLEDAFHVAGQLFTLLKSVGSLLAVIFGGDDVVVGSQDFLDSLIEMTDRLTAFFKSADGQDALKSLGEAIVTIGAVLVITADAIIWTVRALDWFVDAIDSAVVWVIEFGMSVGRWFGMAGDTIQRWYNTAKDAIVGFFTETIPEAFATAAAWFQGLPDRIIAAAGNLRERLTAWATDAVLGLVDGFFVNIGRLIGFFLILPGLIQNALVALPGQIAAIFEAAWTWVVARAEAFWATLSAFFLSIPGRLVGARDAIVAYVGSIFSSAADQGAAFVRGGIDRIQSFFNELPGRIAALGPRLLEAARSLGRKIGEGLSNIGDFASDIGRKIVNTIKSGLNYVIRSINSGIGEIDALVPGSLPRLPQFERGGIVDSPTVALIGEKNKREVILPLTDPARANQLAQQSGLMDILKGGAQGATNVYVTAIIDGYGLVKVIDTRVSTALDTQGSELAYGPRS